MLCDSYSRYLPVCKFRNKISLFLILDNGHTVVIRTCSMEDWGTQCGDIFFEQDNYREQLTGCLATCPFDGCNSARPSGGFITVAPSCPFMLITLVRNNMLILLCLSVSILLSRKLKLFDTSVFLTGERELLKCT